LFWEVRLRLPVFVQRRGVQLAVMLKQMGVRPSELLRVDDELAAWCLDEAVFDILLRLGQKQKLRPQKTTNNTAVIAMLKGGGKRGA
jgi:hypothetical protein